MPPINGLVLSSVKENELVEVPLTSPLPAGQSNPLLAHWTYGLGRSVAFTSDAGRRWAKAWPDWASYAAFWSQVVRWSMRPVDRGNLTLSVRRDQGRIKVVVDALDKDNQFLNFLQIQGNLVNPDLKRSSVKLEQTAPGKYEATIEDAEASGNYFVNLGYRGPDNIQGVISSGVSVPYSDEYRELRSNPATLETIASLTNGQVASWKFRPDGRVDLQRTIDSADHFRRDPSLVNPPSYTDMWPNLLWLAAVMFLGDVAVRRVAPDVARIRRHGRRPVEEDPRPGGRPAGRVHGEAQGPQGRGRRAARPLARRHPVRSPPAGRPDDPGQRAAPGGRPPSRRAEAVADEARRPRPRPRAEAARARELHQPSHAGQAKGVGGAREGQGQTREALLVSRFTVANILALIAVLAVGLAAMRDGSDLTERAAFSLMLVALFVGLVGAIVRRSEGAWVGFAICGWGYALLAFVPAISREVAPHLLTTEPLDGLVKRLSPPAAKPPAIPQLNSQYMTMIGSMENLSMSGGGSPGNFHRSLLSPDEQKTLDDYLARYQTYQTQELGPPAMVGQRPADRPFTARPGIRPDRGHAGAGPVRPARSGAATSPVTTAVDANHP